MSLDDEYTEFLAKPRNCKVCKWLSTADDEAKDFFNRRGPDNVAKIARFCSDKLGMEANETTVRKHFREDHVA